MLHASVFHNFNEPYTNMLHVSERPQISPDISFRFLVSCSATFPHAYIALPHTSAFPLLVGYSRNTSATGTIQRYDCFRNMQAFEQKIFKKNKKNFCDQDAKIPKV
jgi:hypothetical protein